MTSCDPATNQPVNLNITPQVFGNGMEWGQIWQHCNVRDGLSKVVKASWDATFELPRDQSISTSISVNHSSQNRQPLWPQLSSPLRPIPLYAPRPPSSMSLSLFPLHPTQSLITNHKMEMRPACQYLLVGFNGSDIRGSGCILWGLWTQNSNSNWGKFCQLILTTVKSGGE